MNQTMTERADDRIVVQPLVRPELARELGQELLGHVTVDNLRFLTEDATRRGIPAGQHLDMMITAFRVGQLRQQVKGGFPW